MSAHAERLEPVKAPLLTVPFKLLAGLAAFTLLLIPVRFLIGLGPSTGLTDGYPWGLWKIVNVIILTGVASGGYVVALLVNGLNKRHYHPIARLAIATSAVGYTSGVIALGVVDLGRPWNFWRLIDITNWNLHSVLLEIGVCVSLYLVFLWLEMAPPFLDHAKQAGESARTFASRWSPVLEKAYPWIVAMAITLPSMHQSSLGSLFLLAGPRLHGLWQTPMLPGFFLISAWFLGVSAVIIAAMLAHLHWQRPLHLPMLRRLSRVNATMVLIFFVLRFVELSMRDATHLLFEVNRFTLAFWVEIALLIPPSIVLVYGRPDQPAGAVFRMALVTMAGGCFYRFNVCLGGFMPGQGWSYFPSVMEIVMCAGMVALGIVAYLVMVKTLPIIDNSHPVASH